MSGEDMEVLSPVEAAEESATLGSGTNKSADNARGKGEKDQINESRHRPDADPIALAPLEELCGRLEGVDHAENAIWIRLSSGTVRFALDASAVHECLEKLRVAEGERVGILRTLDSENPIRVRRD